MIDRLDSECPHCGRRLKIRAEYAGLVICCNACERLIRVHRSGEVRTATMGEVDFVPKEDYFLIRNELVSLQSRLDARDEEFRGLEARLAEAIERSDALVLQLNRIEPAATDAKRLLDESVQAREHADRRSLEADALRSQAESRLAQAEIDLKEAGKLRQIAETNSANEHKRTQAIESEYRSKLEEINSAHRRELEEIEVGRRGSFEANDREHRQEIERLVANASDSERIQADRIEELQTLIDTDRKVIGDLRALAQERVDRSIHDAAVLDRDRLAERVERLEQELVDRNRGHKTAERSLLEAAEARSQTRELQTLLKTLEASAADEISAREATIASLHTRLNELEEHNRDLTREHSSVLSAREATISLLNKRLNDLESRSRSEIGMMKTLAEEREALLVRDQENSATIAAARAEIALASTHELELVETIERLTEQIENERIERERVQARAASQIDELTRDHARVVGEWTIRHNDIQALLYESESRRASSIDEFESEITRIRGGFQAGLESSAERIAELELEFARQGVEREYWRERSSRSERDRDEHAERIRENDKRFNDCVAKHVDEIDSLRKRIDDERESSASVRSRAEVLTSSLIAAERRVEQMVNGLRLAESRVQDLMLERQADERRIAELTSSLIAAECRVDESATGLRSFERRVQELTSERQADERRIAELTSSLIAAERRVEESATGLRLAESRVQELKSGIAESEVRIVRANQAAADADRARRESEASVAGLRSDFDAATSDRQSEIGALERNIDGKKAEIHRLIVERAASLEARRAIEEELERIKLRLVESQHSNQEYEHSIVSIKQEHNQLVIQWDQSRSANERTIAELESRVETAEAENRGLSSQLEHLRSETERLEREAAHARAEADASCARLSAEVDRVGHEAVDERRRLIVEAAERESLIDRLRKAESIPEDRFQDSAESLQPVAADLSIVDKSKSSIDVEARGARSGSFMASLDATSAGKFVEVLSQHLRIVQTLNKHLRTLYEQRRFQGARGETVDASARSEELAARSRSARDQIESEWRDWLTIYRAKHPRRPASSAVELGQFRRRIEMLSHQLLSVQNTNDRLQSLFREHDAAATAPRGGLDIESGAITIEVDSVVTEV